MMLDERGTVTVSEIMRDLCVSDMTVRRDLTEMEKQGLLIRTYGGAQRIFAEGSGTERSHAEKKRLQETEKSTIACKAASLVKDGETVFLGPGTTLELMAAGLKDRNIRVVTNSLPVFEILKCSPSADLLLVGGEYRSVTGAFVGIMSLNAIANMRFSKAFISVNGADLNSVYTYSEAEGEVQKAALDNAGEKYLTADSSKFTRCDFYEFYKISDFDHIITDGSIPDDVLAGLEEKTDVIIS